MQHYLPFIVAYVAVAFIVLGFLIGIDHETKGKNNPFHLIGMAVFWPVTLLITVGLLFAV